MLKTGKHWLICWKKTTLLWVPKTERIWSTISSTLHGETSILENIFNMCFDFFPSQRRSYFVSGDNCFGESLIQSSIALLELFTDASILVLDVISLFFIASSIYLDHRESHESFHFWKTLFSLMSDNLPTRLFSHTLVHHFRKVSYFSLKFLLVPSHVFHHHCQSWWGWTLWIVSLPHFLTHFQFFLTEGMLVAIVALSEVKIWKFLRINCFLCHSLYSLISLLV